MGVDSLLTYLATSEYYASVRGLFGLYGPSVRACFCSWCLLSSSEGSVLLGCLPAVALLGKDLEVCPIPEQRITWPFVGNDVVHLGIVFMPWLSHEQDRLTSTCAIWA